MEREAKTLWFVATTYVNGNTVVNGVIKRTYDISETDSWETFENGFATEQEARNERNRLRKWLNRHGFRDASLKVFSRCVEESDKKEN